MKRFFLFSAILALGICITAFIIQYFTNKELPVDQKQIFLQAETALKQGNTRLFHRLQSKIKTYPLYPYLTYEDLGTRINSYPKSEIDRFLKKNKNSYLANELRNEWLLALARGQKWKLFLHYYEPAKESQLKCLYGQALYKTGNKTQALTVGKNLWLVGNSQASDCDELFDLMQKEKALTPTLIWQRFYLAIGKNNLKVAEYLKNLFPDDIDRKRAELWIEVQKNPRLITNKTKFPDNDQKNNELIAYGLSLIANDKPQEAVKLWDTFRRQHFFTEIQTQQVILAIAVNFIKTTQEKPVKWLQQVNPQYLTKLAMSWRLRYALEEENWRGLLLWIKELPPLQQQKLKWQYWQARSLEELGHRDEAFNIFSHLAKNREYYGFLAAYHIHAPYPISNIPLPYTPEELGKIKSNPGILRVKELFELSRLEEANREWRFTLMQMPDKERYIATKYALNEHWTPMAFSSAFMVPYQGDLDIRYPTLYQDVIKPHATAAHIDPAYVYAIIRQESMFKPSAASYAGAIGLMQLLLSTANPLLKERNLPEISADKLNDPATNVKIGSLYLNELLKMNNEHLILSTASYNAGPSRVHKWLPGKKALPVDVWVDTIPYPETRTYVKHVITNLLIYQYLLGEMPDLSPAMKKITVTPK